MLEYSQYTSIHFMKLILCVKVRIAFAYDIDLGVLRKNKKSTSRL